MLSAAAAKLQHAKLVTAAPWIVAATLMGTLLERNGAVVANFSSYSDAVLRALSRTTDLSPTEFEAALHQSGDVELEIERESVLRELAAQRNVPAWSMFPIVAIIVILVGIAVVFAAMTLMKGEPIQRRRVG